MHPHISGVPDSPTQDRARAFVRTHTRALTPALCPELRLHLVDALSDLWQVGERELGEHGVTIPFWAAAWPGGQAVARFVLDLPGAVRGARVLDLGSGSGICAIAAAMAGAHSVLAVDTDPVACEAVALNAALNQVAVSARAADLLDAPPPEVDVILAADLWYEAPLASRVTPWLRAAAGRGVRVLAGDLGRAYLPSGGMVEIASYDVPTSTDLEQLPVTTTRVFRCHPG
jgi:predicted nicotinamide N-methyase